MPPLGERERQRGRQREREMEAERERSSLSLPPEHKAWRGLPLSDHKVSQPICSPISPEFFPFLRESLSPAPICLDLHIMNLFAVSLATGPLTKQPQTETRAEHRSRSSWHTASEHLLNNI